DLADHAPHGVAVLQRLAAMKLVETEADKNLALDLGPARRARDLLDRQCFAFGTPVERTHGHWSYSGEISAVGRRAARISATDLPRLLAIIFGLYSALSASKVARTML